ncbi:MAG: short-chain dehydrogenase, partial [Zymomonas sp.]
MPLLLVLGATSDMARAAAFEFCRNGWDLVLAARDVEAAKVVGRDLALRTGRSADAFETCAFDALAPETHSSLWNGLLRRPDGVLCAIGGGGDPSLAQHDLSLAD